MIKPYLRKENLTYILKTISPNAAQMNSSLDRWSKTMNNMYNWTPNLYRHHHKTFLTILWVQEQMVRSSLLKAFWENKNYKGENDLDVLFERERFYFAREKICMKPTTINCRHSAKLMNEREREIVTLSLSTSPLQVIMSGVISLIFSFNYN